MTTRQAMARLQSASDVIRPNLDAFSDAQLSAIVDEGLVLARNAAAELAHRRGPVELECRGDME